MIYDDRIQTILAGRPAGPEIARAQFRQLIDLLAKGIAGRESDNAIAERLKLIDGLVSNSDLLGILREMAPKPRSVALVAQLARMSGEFADFAVERAELEPDEWLAVLPRLSPAHRSTLAFRSNLPEAVLRSLSRDIAPRQPIRELIRRIDQYRASQAVPANVLPAQKSPRKVISLELDPSGMVVKASDFPGALCGRRLLGASDTFTQLAPAGRDRLAAMLPCRSFPLSLGGSPQVSGEWLLDAVPLFDPVSLAFQGHRCLIEPAGVSPSADELAVQAESGRAYLHELRTPLNAILGFAEALQQQMLGPLPASYRAAAAGAIAEASRMLAACEEADELVRLENGEPGPEGKSDLIEELRRSLEAVSSLAAARGVSVTSDLDGYTLPVSVPPETARKLIWALFTDAVGALEAGGAIRVRQGVGEFAIETEGSAGEAWMNRGPFPQEFNRRLADLRARSFGGRVNFGANRTSLKLSGIHSESSALVA